MDFLKRNITPYLGIIDFEKLKNPHRIKLPRLLITLISVIIIVWLLIPQQNLKPFYHTIPLNGRVILTNELSKGRLYKVIIKGRYNNSTLKNRLQKNNTEGVLPKIYINNSPVVPDIIIEKYNEQVFYVPGKGTPVEIRIIDEGWGGMLGFSYLDNTGEIITELEEANFKIWMDTKPYLQSERLIFYYTLDPIPGKDDRIFFRLLDKEGNTIYYRDTTEDIEFLEGYPTTITSFEENEFMWFGCKYSDKGEIEFINPGSYILELGMLRKGDEFIASPPPGEDIPIYIAITHRMSGTFPKVVHRTEYSNNQAFPYCTHRCLKQVQSFPAGIKGIYTPKEGVGNDFLFFGERGPWTGYGEVAPECLGLIQRTLNIIKGAYTEIYQKKQGDKDLIDITSTFDHPTRRLNLWFKNEFKVDTKLERKILKKHINLPPMTLEEASTDELSYIIGGDTLKAMLNVEFKLKQFPEPIYLEDLDNLPSYNPDDKLHSLYHLFDEVGRWANDKTKYTKQPKDKGNLKDGVIYDISDDAFIALLMAVSYQESGFVQRTGSGRIFRAGSGWGSATGYMQLTSDVIWTDSYVIRFFSDDGVTSKSLGNLPKYLKYFVRNVNRWNIEIGAQFLKEMWENCGRSSFDKRFREEMRRGGLLDPTNQEGLIKRIKITGASYNAGPEALRVMIHYPYDNPRTETNESVALYFDDYDADFEEYVKRFRDDLLLHSRGTFTFPMEETSKGREIFYKLVHWLGPYWKQKIEGISWEEAAIMKLDREVIKYVHNTSINLPKLLNRDVREKIFRDKLFGVLVVKTKKEEEEKTPSSDNDKDKEKPDVERPSDILPQPEE